MSWDLLGGPKVTDVIQWISWKSMGKFSENFWLIS